MVNESQNIFSSNPEDEGVISSRNLVAIHNEKTSKIQKRNNINDAWKVL